MGYLVIFILFITFTAKLTDYVPFDSTSPNISNIFISYFVKYFHN